MARSVEHEKRLEAAYTRYETALVAGDRLEVTTARLALCRTLEAAGWVPPTEVREQIQRDEKALRRMAETDHEPAAPLLRPPSHRSPWVE